MPAPDPTPPPELPERVVDELADTSSDLLRRTARYLEDLAEHRERAEPSSDQNTSDQNASDSPADRPEGVPSKATITVKEINDNRYYYWQWREGDTVKSKYKGPVDSE